MTDSADASLRTLAELVAGVIQNLRSGDGPNARTQAAAIVEQLRELASAADRQRAPGTPATFDAARLTTALAAFADWLRAPSPQTEARAQQAVADLRAAFGPLVGAATASAEAAQREQYRQNAVTAIEDYFRDNPIKPFKPFKP